MSYVTGHVLDSVVGLPASGVAVTLARAGDKSAPRSAPRFRK